MAAFVFNIAKGRVVELFNRVDGNDPANGVIVLIPFGTIGSEAQGQDLATLAAVEADANFAEQAGGGWVRKVLTDSDLAAIAVDNGNNRFPATLPQVVWTTPTAGSDTLGLIVAYDSDSTGGADSAIIPLVCLDFVVETDGNDVQLNTGDCFRAT